MNISLKKLNKGFTLIELVVVIAIVGVMSAILVPLGIAIFGTNDESNTYAKNFYYAAQDVMTDIKLDDGATPTIPSSQTCLIYFQMNADGAIVGDVSARYDATETALAGSSTSGAPLSDTIKDTMKTRFSQLMKHNEKNGYYYAVVDDHYRVTAAYWSDGDFDSLKAKSFKFTGDYDIDGYHCGAYPINAAQKDEFLLS